MDGARSEKRNPAWWWVAATVGLGACNNGDPAAVPGWHVELTALPQAVLSVGEDAAGDVWLTGADRRDGRGPLLLKGNSSAWQAISTGDSDPDGGHLWWSWSTPPGGSGATWVVGENGRIFRIDAAGNIKRIDAGTDATFYGIWGADEAELWVVGGFVYPRSGPPTLVRITNDIAEVVTAPVSEWPENGTLFKVWGRARNDVVVVGERGMMLQFQGTSWRRVPVADAMRLVTVHGSANRTTVVGGVSQAVILEQDRSSLTGWLNRSPPGLAMLNGVWLAGAEAGWAVGMLGVVLTRNDLGLWLPVDVPQWSDWHAVRVDQQGDVWIVGGSLLSAARMDEGVVLRFGPPRNTRDLPQLPDAVTVADGVITDDVSNRGDGFVDTPEPPDSDDIHSNPETDGTSIISDMSAPDALTDAVESPDVIDFSTLSPDTPTPDTSAHTPQSTPFSPGLGVAAYGVDPQTPTMLADDDTALMIHGPQGGFHLEIVVHASDLGIDPTIERHDLETRLDLTVAGVEVAGFGPGTFPFWSKGNGTWEASVFPLIFQRGFDRDEPRAGDFDGRDGLLSVAVMVGTTTRSGSVRVRLVDTW